MFVKVVSAHSSENFSIEIMNTVIPESKPILELLIIIPVLVFTIILIAVVILGFKRATEKKMLHMQSEDNNIPSKD